jgi:hypothetical protein
MSEIIDRPLAGFHVVAAVDGRRRVLQPLIPARGQPGRDDLGRATGWPRVRATGPGISPGRRGLALCAAGPAISLGRGLPLSRTRRSRRTRPGRRAG